MNNIIVDPDHFFLGIPDKANAAVPMRLSQAVVNHGGDRAE
jgi:hypothetical protein